MSLPTIRAELDIIRVLTIEELTGSKHQLLRNAQKTLNSNNYHDREFLEYLIYCAELLLSHYDTHFGFQQNQIRDHYEPTTVNDLINRMDMQINAIKSM